MTENRDRLSLGAITENFLQAVIALCLLGASVSCNSSKKNDPCSWVETGTSFSILPRDLKNIMLNKAYQGQISKVNTCPIEAIYTGKNGEKGKLNSSELLNGEFGPTTKPFSKVTIRPQD